MTSFSKDNQISRTRRIHREPDQLRALLGISIPTSKTESESRRYGKCSHPKCGNVGTIDRPLDLHHIVPRSQSRAMINEYSNHLYLCGDFFMQNHHKALHGEATPGLVDWRQLGIFGEWAAEAACPPSQRVDGLADRLVDLASSDSICRVLIRQDVYLALDYAIRKGVIQKSSVLFPEDIKYISDFKF